MNKTQVKIILATGGTGGHIFPAMAVAEALIAQQATPVFFTDTRFANYNPPEMHDMLREVGVQVVASGRSGGGLKARAMNMLGVARGTLQAIKLLRREAPAMVVGFGGYPSLPTMLAAVLLGIPTMLHEQNAYLGRSNRLLALFVGALCTSYPNTHGLPAGASKKTHFIGNPVRRAIHMAADTPYPSRKAGMPLHVLIIGGSQGAKVFGDVVPEAVTRLSNDERAMLRLVQQVRPENLESVQARYTAMGVQAECAAFFPEIAARMADAHMLISRAGASSVAECCVAGRPAIYIPLPSAMDNHQWFNAQSAAEQGAAWRMAQADATPECLAELLRRAIAQPDELTQMAACAKTLGAPDAAEQLAARILNACEQKKS